jgi:uncharacterized protein YpuA (DUF1002 family)
MSVKSWQEKRNEDGGMDRSKLIFMPQCQHHQVSLIFNEVNKLLPKDHQDVMTGDIIPNVDRIDYTTINKDLLQVAAYRLLRIAKEAAYSQQCEEVGDFLTDILKGLANKFTIE